MRSAALPLKATKRALKKTQPAASQPAASQPLVFRRGALDQKKNAHGGGWVLFLGISGPEKHLFVFRFLKTHRLK
jgi:hypothetical protein